MRLPLPLAGLLAGSVLLLPPRLAGSDEIRLRDGEVIHGSVQASGKGWLHLRVAGQERRVRQDEVDAILAGPDPYLLVRRTEESLPAEDASGRLELAAQAWRHGLDAEARRLAGLVVALDPSRAQAQHLLGRHRAGDAWVAGWPPAWGGPGRTGPRWGEARRAALARGGGTQATEDAVRRALDWLAAHQEADGSLDADGFMRHDPEGDRCDGAGGGHHGERVPCPYDGVTTAVALMAWLASGSTPVSGPYRDHVARALHVVRAVARTGPQGSYGLWNHGFCTQALADACTVTRDPGLLVDLQAAVAGLLGEQRPDGGWSYYLPIGDVPTTGVAGAALALAIQAGVVVPREPVERLLAFLDARLDAESGRSEYHDGAERKGYTPTRANAAAALTVRALLGRLDGAPRLARQVAAIDDKPVWSLSFKEVKTRDGRTVRAQVGNLYPYLWYYTTVALFERGSTTWSAWFGGLKKALLKGQRQDGACAGSWDPLGTYSDSAGRVFVTGLCTLMLQSPYRYPRAP